ncbi:MAG: type IV secretory system conjugative DNA transfer family protein, partial [Mogibacterium sp.]|nr:type IV secretory system conjugative DNA transfer family protein [Mogibacterium sp.]
TRVSSFTHTIMTNTKDEDAKTDAFFDQNEEMLLTALVLYVAVSPHFKGEPHERHMGTVYDLLTKLAAQEGILEELADLPESDPAKVPWKMFQGSGKLKTNFITGLAAKLNLFQDDMLKEIMSHSEIDLREAGRSKCAYYIISPVDNNKMTFMLSLFFSCAFEQLMQDASKNPGNKLKVPVTFILDEFKAIGRINTFADKIANTRKYLISIMIIFQDIQQLEQAYPGSFETILSCCDTWLVLGVNNTATAQRLCEKIGTSTARTRSTSKQMMEKQFVSPVNSAISQSESESGRNFMNPDEIERYFDPAENQGRKIMILSRAKNVYLADAYGWPNHHLAKDVPDEGHRRKAKDFVPDWQAAGELTMDKKRSFLDLSAQIEYAGKADSTELRRKTIMQNDSPKKAASRLAAEKKPDPEDKPEVAPSDTPADNTNAKTEAHKKGIILDTSEKSSHLMTLGEEKKITSFGLDLFGDEGKKKGGKKK